MTHADNIEAAVRDHAERIMNAAGSSLRNYSVYGTQERILAAVIDCYEEAYRAGAALAIERDAIVAQATPPAIEGMDK